MLENGGAGLASGAAQSGKCDRHPACQPGKARRRQAGAPKFGAPAAAAKIRSHFRLATAKSARSKHKASYRSLTLLRPSFAWLQWAGQGCGGQGRGDERDTGIPEEPQHGDGGRPGRQILPSRCRRAPEPGRGRVGDRPRRCLCRQSACGARDGRNPSSPQAVTAGETSW